MTDNSWRLAMGSSVIHHSSFISHDKSQKFNPSFFTIPHFPHSQFSQFHIPTFPILSNYNIIDSHFHGIITLLDQRNEQMIYIVILMMFAGIEVIGKVPSVLHTPLMSGANAIHGVVIIGAIIVMGKAATDNYLALGLGFWQWCWEHLTW
jgi:hypothetical protein